MKNFYNSIVNLGVKSTYQPWEKHLVRKLNSLSFISVLNLLVGILFFILIDYTAFIFVCVAGFLNILIVFLLNRFKNYVWASYLFFTYGFFGFFIPIIKIMGLNSYVGLFYFPFIISMVMLMGKKETMKQFIVLSIFCIISVTMVAFGYKLGYIRDDLPGSALSNLRVFNLITCITATLCFILTIVSESIKQEELIKKMLAEKEILLAEVFHRVKNNMNIITSLLNLKKNLAESKEVKNALEECQNRVYSMALVHQNIFSAKNTVDLNFKTYLEKLTCEMSRSFGKEKGILIDLDADDVRLEVTSAIPSGLILNELITNSFKHAQPENGPLHIQIKLKHQDRNIELQVKDNGLGMQKEKQMGHTLGLELIKDLSKQLNGSYSFKNDSGLVFNLKFKC